MRNNSSPAARYKYAVVWFQPSLLGPDDAVPFAVVVEGEHQVSAVGRHVEDFDRADAVSGDILKRFPKIFIDQVELILRSGRPADVMEALAEVFRWNVFLGAPAFATSELPINEFAYALFARQVVGAEAPGGPTSYHQEQSVFDATIATPSFAGGLGDRR